VVSSSALDLSPRRGVPQNEVQDRFIIRVLYPFPRSPGEASKTAKSLRHLEPELREQDYPISSSVLGSCASSGLQFASQPQDLGGRSHPYRNTQSQYVAQHVGAFQRQGQPDISVGGKKKEQVENFKAADCGQLVLFHQPRQWNSGSVCPPSFKI
jgi:hypothetical protein